MAKLIISGKYKNNNIKIVVSLSSSRRNVYKRVEYYINGKRTTRNNKIIKEITKNAEGTVLTANTYFWSGFFGNWSEREKRAEKMLKEVSELIKMDRIDKKEIY